MKKLLFLFILIFTAFSVSALASAFDVGVNLSYNNADEVVDESVYSGSLNLDKIAVGLEMRGNISNFQMTIAGDISILDTQSVMFSGIFGAGISVDLFKYLKFGITTGPKVTYIYRGKMNSVDNNGDLIEADNFFTALAKGDFHYRLMFDVLAGPVMSLCRRSERRDRRKRGGRGRTVHQDHDEAGCGFHRRTERPCRKAYGPCRSHNLRRQRHSFR